MIDASGRADDMTTTTARRRLLGAVAATAAAILALSACGGGDGDGVASAGGKQNAAAPAETASPTPADPDAQALVFAECMRDNGVDMPDPGPGQQGLNDAFQSVAGKYDRETLQTAVAACQDRMPQYAQEQQHEDGWQLELAECLREQGLDVSDDPFEDAHQGRIDVGEFSAAMEVCRDVLIDGGQ
jgi:hypothetical protein